MLSDKGFAPASHESRSEGRWLGTLYVGSKIHFVRETKRPQAGTGLEKHVTTYDWM